MSARTANNLVRRWVALGAMFAVASAREPVDLELLLLDTARHVAGHSRLFEMCVTWLTRYGDYVAAHRLARMILDDLHRDHRPTLGLMLDWAQALRGDRRFNKAIQACGQAIDARPLFDIDRRNTFFERLAERNAAAISKKWGRWVEEFELKDNALRPAHWIAKHNPHLRLRALCAGDLCASILAETFAQDGRSRYASELAIAHAFVASRGAVRDALRKLDLSGMLRRAPERRSSAIEIRFSTSESLLKQD